MSVRKITGSLAGPAGGEAKRNRSGLLATLGLAALALIWGYNWVEMKTALNYSQPFTFAALRAFGGAVFLFLLLLVMRRPLRPKALALTALVGLLQTSCFLGLAMWALLRGGAGKTSVLVYIMPFWLLLVAWPVLGEKLRDWQWVAVGLALVGLVLILSPWNMQGSFSSTCLAVAAGIAWAGSALGAKVVHRRHQVDLLSFTAWQTLLGSVPLLILAGLTWKAAPVWSGSFVAALAFNIVPALGLALLLWFWVLRALPAGRAGLGTLATPVVGIVSAWMQLGERPGASEEAGMFLIVIGLALLAGREMAAARQSRVAEGPTT
jgi:drug/metabolite transporter (DMT)-like permease